MIRVGDVRAEQTRKGSEIVKHVLIILLLFLKGVGGLSEERGADAPSVIEKIW